MSHNHEQMLRQIFTEGLNRVATWLKREDCNYLRSIFDMIGFRDRKPDEELYYVPPELLGIAPVYPVKFHEATVLASARQRAFQAMTELHEGFSEAYLGKLSQGQLFYLLEQYGTNIPADEQETISLFDAIKVRAAESVIAVNRSENDPAPRLLIVADISGIQRFIYNIVSSGALKNLRSRSFFVELISHHSIARILETFGLHQANILMNGGGTVHILSHCPEDYIKRLEGIDDGINNWLLKEFNGILHLSLCAVPWPDGDTLGNVLEHAGELVFARKHRRFERQIEQEKFDFEEKADPGYEHCEVCYKDGSPSTLIEKKDDNGAGTSDYRCPLCDTLVRLGQEIPITCYIYRCDEATINTLQHRSRQISGEPQNYQYIEPRTLQLEDSYYFLSEELQPQLNDCCWVVFDGDAESCFLNRLPPDSTHILARTYIKRFGELDENVKKKYPDSKADEMATMEQLAESAVGASFIGALRMDADNVGKILRHGFQCGSTPELLSSFSRNINYFFRLHLEHICRNGFNHDTHYECLQPGASGRLVQAIYAGGDDLFVVGAWHDTAALAVDIGHAFGRYTCNNPDMGISAGLTLHQPRFPVVKMAEESAAALKCAKNDQNPCWMCHAEWPTCPLFDVGACLRKNAFSPFYTGYLAHRKREIDVRHTTPRYREHSSRLTMALKWKKWDECGVTNEVEQYILQPLAMFHKGRSTLKKGFFHNSLQLLETWYEEGVLYLPRLVWAFDKIRQELKRKAEGEHGENLHDLLMMHMHLYNPGEKEGNKKFATLHMPLSWIILHERGGKRNGEA